MDDLQDLLRGALRKALIRTEAAEGSGASNSAHMTQGPLYWDIPKDPTFGDLSTSAPFKLAARRKQPPAQTAQELATLFLACCRDEGLSRWVDRVESKGGFLNVFLSQEALSGVLEEILQRGSRYGTRPVSPPKRMQIEFVSANPTGPLSVAHGRQAAVGDVLARLLRAQGYEVTTEYYLNDEGRQIELLGRSLRARYLQALERPEPFPDDGYHGLYVKEHAAECVARYQDQLVDAPLERFVELGMARQLDEIRRTLDAFGLQFDRWTSQRWLRTSGKIDAALEQLRSTGALYEAEEATWFASTKFGDDKDRVVRKRDGELTYLAPDIAYHQWKFQSGYDQLVDLWGPDHHGYIARIQAAMTALGCPADRLVVRIVQLVTLSRSGKPVPMSKRQGEFVTFQEVLDEVGADATRFFFLMRTMESHLDFDLELAKSQSKDNPVYYVQYAHARISSILGKATSEQGADAAEARTDWPLLDAPEERLLMRWLFQYPIVLRLCAAALEPHGLTAYLRKLAESFHIFYTRHRVISEDPQRSSARLALIKAARHVLANGLEILGVSAPTRMSSNAA